MAIKCATYGGKIGWLLRKHFSKYTSEAYLSFQYLVRKRLFKKYIKYFDELEHKENPCLISIETINRCNSTCDFCPANRNTDQRPFKKMDEELFHKIIDDMQDMNYQGYLNLYVNNEPLMDKRIEDWYRYAKEHLPKAKMLLYTNGTLLTKERFINLIPYIDKMIINNYSDKLKLHENIKEIYDFTKSSKEFYNKDITIQIRYIHEILTNRAGKAPNKRKGKCIHKLCIMPFTDVTIFPDGTIGLCCNDVLEKTNYGNVRDSSLSGIWNSDEYSKLRLIIGIDRENYGFCKGCDFVDAGIRNIFMKSRLKKGSMDENISSDD